MANFHENVRGEEHVVAESSKLKATTAGHIYDLECHKDLDNGTIVAIGVHVDGQLFKAKDYVAGEKPYLVLTAPVAYDNRKARADEKYFYNAKGEVARAYELHVGDIYTVSKVAFDGEPAVGKYIDAAYAVAETAGATGYVGEIIEEVAYTNGTSYRILVREIAKAAQ